MSEEIIIAIITGVTTVIGSGLLSFFISKKKAKRDDFTAVTDLIKEDNERLREEIEEIKKENKLIRAELDEVKDELSEERATTANLRADLLLLETAHHDLPLPQWLKDSSGIMLSLNDAYEAAFLIPQGKTRADYVGHTDVDIWGEEIGARYRRNDEIAQAKRKATVFREPMPVGDFDLTEDFIVLKYPRYKGRTLIGIGGIMFPVSYYEMTKPGATSK